MDQFLVLDNYVKSSRTPKRIDKLYYNFTARNKTFNNKVLEIGPLIVCKGDIYTFLTEKVNFIRGVLFTKVIYI